MIADFGTDEVNEFSPAILPVAIADFGLDDTDDFSGSWFPDRLRFRFCGWHLQVGGLGCGIRHLRRPVALAFRELSRFFFPASRMRHAVMADFGVEDVDIFVASDVAVGLLTLGWRSWTISGVRFCG